MNNKDIKCFFISDLHGNIYRYKTLFNEIIKYKPHAVFIGGDILPGLKSLYNQTYNSFIKDFLEVGFRKIYLKLKTEAPQVFIIPGNDDAAIEFQVMSEGEDEGLWQIIHNKKTFFKEYTIFGYACIPPSPFLLKDWERYDISMYTDPNCIHPYEGLITNYNINKDILKYSTIKNDLEILTNNENLNKAIILFHSPPYNTSLDRAALDNKTYEYVPLDVHIGSIAIRQFIEEKQPLITLHGHVHESTAITGQWQEKIGNTYCYSASHNNNKELSLIIFNPHMPEKAKRILI